ncbi:MAG: hypothetical protein U0270_20070 [Labilithrix sp.]
MRKYLAHTPITSCTRQIVDERSRRREERVEAVLDGAVGNGDREVRLSATGLAGEDQPASVGDEVGREERGKEGKTESRLQGEVEVVDRLEEGKVCTPGQPTESRLLAMRDLFSDERGEEVAVAPAVLLCARDKVAPDAPRVGEVKALQQIVDRDVGCIHVRVSC